MHAGAADSKRGVRLIRLLEYCWQWFTHPRIGEVSRMVHTESYARAAASILWIGAAVGGFYMFLGVVWGSEGVPLDSPFLAPALAVMVFTPVFLLGFDLYLAYRLWRNPVRWLLVMALIMTLWTCAMAASEIAVGHVSDSDATTPVLQAAIGAAAALAAGVATFLVRSDLPRARCPHCGSHLPLRAWRSCPDCGVVLRSAR